MNPPIHTARRNGQRGQALVLFALLLIVIIGAAGLLIDGGRAWGEKRQAQAAADFAALAAARAIADAGIPCNATGLALGQAAARAVADFNDGPDHPWTVVVEYPATSSASYKGCSYVLVRVSRTMATTFSRVMGEEEWTPSADAVVKMTRTVTAVASCTFCSLNNSDKNHTLKVELGSNGEASRLVVDGDIVVNSSNGKKASDTGSGGKWIVEGDAFDIFGVGGRIDAKRITVVGGWETHDNGIAVAQEATCPLAQRPTPPQYLLLSPPITQSNICIHQPPLTDPLAAFIQPLQADYLVQSTSKYTCATGTCNIQPGVYISGIAVSGTGNLVMAPGLYFIAGGGFAVTGNGSVDAPAVTIYNSAGANVLGKAISAGNVNISTNGRVVIGPDDNGVYGGMTVFQQRASSKAVTLNPNNSDQCASVASPGEPQGCMGGLSGTIYAPNSSALVTVNATGTANLQVIAGKLLVKNGGVARFTYKASGFASVSTTTTIVE